MIGSPQAPWRRVGPRSCATGAAVIDVKGSHGLLDLALVTSFGDPVLDSCATDSISNGRRSRELGDTDHHIGFVLTATYAWE